MHSYTRLNSSYVEGCPVDLVPITNKVTDSSMRSEKLKVTLRPEASLCCPMLKTMPGNTNTSSYCCRINCFAGLCSAPALTPLHFDTDKVSAIVLVSTTVVVTNTDMVTTSDNVVTNTDMVRVITHYTGTDSVHILTS